MHIDQHQESLMAASHSLRIQDDICALPCLTAGEGAQVMGGGWGGGGVSMQ